MLDSEAGKGRRLLLHVAKSDLDALVQAALVARGRAGLDVAFACGLVDQREGGGKGFGKIRRFLGGQRAAHGADLVTETRSGNAVEKSTTFGLPDTLQGRKCIRHLVVLIL